MLLGAGLVGVLANDLLPVGVSRSTISRSDGIVLILFFVLFMIHAWRVARKTGLGGQTQIREYPVNMSVVMVVAGMLALVIGGRWIVNGAVDIAGQLGLSEAVISLSVVAIGTSLPELAACVAAALKKNAGMVIGNVLGSNIFNVFFVLGTSAVIKPLPFNKVLNFDILVGLGAVMLLWLLVLSSRNKALQRWHGGLFIALYAGYLLFLFYFQR